MAARIIVCRHPETDDNLEGIYSGHRDTPLNEAGKEQARKLAARIVKNEPGIAAIFSSDLKRAAFVADCIGKLIGKKPVLCPRLRAVHIGAMTGMRRTDAKRLYPQEEFNSRNPYFDFTSIGGENADQVVGRYKAVLRQIMSQLPTDATLVVVAHGTTLRLVLQQRMGLIAERHAQGDYQVVSLTIDD